MDTLSVYLDTSAIVPLFVPDVFVARVRSFLGTKPAGVVLSDLGAAEFTSVLSMRIRMKLLVEPNARTAIANFDHWVATVAFRAECMSADIRAAEAFLRRLDLPLRTPDAIHIAIAQRVGASLATFDDRMARCARALGTPVIPL